MFAFLPFDRARDVHGVFQRMQLFVDGLARVADQLDLLFLVPPDTDMGTEAVRRHEADLRAAWNSQVNVILCPRALPRPLSATRVGRIKALLRGIGSIHGQPLYAAANGEGPRRAIESCLERHPSLLFVHDLRAMTALLGWSVPLPPVLFDIDNVDHRLQFRRLLTAPGWPAERLRLIWLPALMRGESEAYRRSRRVFVCSEKDERYLHALGVKHARVIPNAVGVPADAPPHTVAKRLLFLGSLNYEPNAEAAGFLISRIWPSILDAEPDAELWIAGREPGHVRGYENPPRGVRFLGFVESLDALYRDVAVVVCPVRVGGGTRIKLVEAAAWAKAIVSTTVGAEGLKLENEVDVLLRDEPGAFAQACVGLLRDSKQARQLGLSAWRQALARYSRPAAVAKVEHEARLAIDLSLR